MLLRNFLLSRAKAELSPHISHLSKKTGAINQSIKKVTTYIDNIVLEYEGVTTKDYLTKRKYEALETVLSYLVQEGYSQVRQEHISKKSGISKPVINYVLTWLQDLGVCQQIKVRRHGKIAPSIYILTIHNNYLKII
ncbi:Replicase RepFR55, partial [Bacillus wiedmannii]